MLLEEGQFRLDDPLSFYLPEFAAPKVVVGGTKDNSQLVAATRPILIKHLFNHTAGFVNPDRKGNLPQRIYDGAALDAANSLAEFVTRLSNPVTRSAMGCRLMYWAA